MKRVIFLNRFFFPDHSATSQILSDLAFHLAASGTETHVIASRQLYDEPAERLPSEETVRGVQIHRVSTSQFGRSRLWGRSIDYLSYYYSSWRLLVALTRRDDILVAMTDPPLVSIVGMRAARRQNAHLVNWLQDVYPEVAIQLNVGLLKSPIGRTISALRDQSLQAAKANVVVGQLMATRIIARNMDPNRVHIIPNWTDDEEISPLPPMDNPLRRQWQLEDKFVVGYSGNLGRPHEFDTILAASMHLKDHPRIVFACIGGGHSFDDLAKRVVECGLRHLFRFFPYQDRILLKYSLGVADVHWISLKPQLEGLIVPSKLYGIAAAGRPIIAITARDGEIAQLIERHDCGIVIAPGDAKALADALSHLSADAARVAEMGQRARAMLDAHFSRRQAFERWRSVLEAVG